MSRVLRALLLALCSGSSVAQYRGGRYIDTHICIYMERVALLPLRSLFCAACGNTRWHTWRVAAVLASPV